MSNGTIKSWVKGVERRQRILKQTSLMRVEFKYENKAVPTESVAGTEASRCRGDDATRRDAARLFISREHLLTPRAALVHHNPYLQGRTEHEGTKNCFRKLQFHWGKLLFLRRFIANRNNVSISKNTCFSNSRGFFKYFLKLCVSNVRTFWYINMIWS